MASKNRWAIAYSGSAEGSGSKDDGALQCVEAARRVADPGRILAVTLERDRPWWESRLRDLPPEHIGAQPFDRGSGAALLYGALALYRRDPTAAVVAFGDGVPPELLREVRHHVQRRQAEPEVLLFATEGRGAQHGGTLVVPRLGASDKGPSLVSSLLPAERGRIAGRALMMAPVLYAQVDALLDLFEAAQPLLTRRMMREFCDRDPFERHAADDLYPFLTAVDLADDVLSAAPDRLLVRRLGRRPELVQPLQASARAQDVARV